MMVKNAEESSYIAAQLNDPFFSRHGNAWWMWWKSMMPFESFWRKAIISHLYSVFHDDLPLHLFFEVSLRDHYVLETHRCNGRIIYQSSTHSLLGYPQFAMHLWLLLRNHRHTITRIYQVMKVEAADCSSKTALLPQIRWQVAEATHWWQHYGKVQGVRFELTQPRHRGKPLNKQLLGGWTKWTHCSGKLLAFAHPSDTISKAIPCS